MIKIIGGTYRSRIIDTPELGTLPTKNMVRGAMLSSLGDRIQGARVLDLFAGSGALGIEALSRGAREAVFVDSNPKAASIVKGNLAKLKETRGKVLCADYLSAIRSLSGAFDIIFLDPPYAMKDSYQKSIDALRGSGLLSEGCALILEYEGAIPFDESAFPFARHYTYGKTNVLALRTSL